MCKYRYSIPRSFWYYVSIATIFMIGAFCWYLFKPGTKVTYALGQFSIHMLSLLLSISFCLLGFQWRRQTIKDNAHSRNYQIQRWIPLLCALAPFFSLLGNIGYLYNYLTQGQWFPTWADVFILCSFIPYMIAIMLFPTRPLSSLRRWRVTMDSCMVLVTCISFSWYFLLGPTVLQANMPWLPKIVAAAFPTIVLLLLCGIVIISYRSISHALKPTVMLITIGLIISVVSNTLYNYELLQQTYNGGWLNLGWVLSYVLVGLAIQALRWRTVTPEGEPPDQEEMASEQRSPKIWHMLLPYALVPCTFLLTLYAWQHDAVSPLAQGVYASCCILVLFVFIRQVLAIYDIHHLNKALHTTNANLEQAQQLLHEKNAALALANQRLEELATSDPLTELPNHRALVILIEQELERAERYERPFSLLFLDIDHFKALNDGYGHPAGDTILYECSHLVRDTIRPLDTIGRWGGEEFIVVLPELGLDESMQMAEQIRATVATHNFHVGGGIHLTCSIGLACFPLHSEQRAGLLQAADQAMYGAKRLGRNQVRTPYDPAVLALVAQSMTEAGREETAMQGIAQALSTLIEASDPALARHCRQVGDLLFTTARCLDVGQEEAQMLAFAGQLHDLGKIALPDRILNKTQPLTNEERHLLYSHPILGAEVVSQIPSLRPLAPVIRSHHERWDGQGYPDQLAGEEIPFGARLLSIVDAYTVMNAGRPYQPACSPTEALQRLQETAGSQFDPSLVEAFVDTMQESLKKTATTRLSQSLVLEEQNS